jgi:hypothetical protein
MGIEHVRSEIEHMRVQVLRQRREILQLQRAGISTAAAELEGCTPRSTTFVLSGSGSRQSTMGPDESARARRSELVMREPLKWYDEKAADSSP